MSSKICPTEGNPCSLELIPTCLAKTCPRLIEAAQLNDLCVSWLFVRPQSEILSETVIYWLPVTACQAVGLLAPNESAVRESSWPVAPSTVPNSLRVGLLQDAEVDGLESKSASGRKLTVACEKYTDGAHDKDSCDNSHAVEMFHLLKRNLNISVDFRYVPSLEELTRGMYFQEWDVTYMIISLQEHDIIFFDFPDIALDHETFFSRKSAHRIVTLSEVFWESWRVVVATLTLIVILTFTQVLLREGVRPSLQGATGTASLLLAAVLATSTTEPLPSTRRGRCLSRALFGTLVRAYIAPFGLLPQ
ncbi:hypothetical protein MTO96_050821 [Rhipicephalus appendiculatus]